MFKVIYILLSFLAFSNAQTCTPSITTASGSAAPSKICSGSLIFEENFDELDKSIWQPEVTFRGGGNGEFQWYVRDDENSYAQDGKLHIKPTLTADKIGADQVESGYVRLEDCTDEIPDNCQRQAGGNVIINPIRSARLITKNAFSFKYGRVEVVAKTPLGDWLWPAIWLLPTDWKYGEWPRSGEIDFLESRGNIKMTKKGDDVQLGVEQVFSTLHFGPRWDQDAYSTASYVRNNASGFHNGFHKYLFVWDESGIRFSIDGTELGFADVGDGFWARGGFTGENIWKHGTKMAPFDQEFHFLINLAVGGTNSYFPDGVINQNGPKPWENSSGKAMKDFWDKRSQWQSSWQPGEQTHLVVDSVKVWAL